MHETKRQMLVPNVAKLRIVADCADFVPGPQFLNGTEYEFQTTRILAPLLHLQLCQPHLGGKKFKAAAWDKSRHCSKGVACIPSRIAAYVNPLLCVTYTVQKKLYIHRR